MREDLEEGHDRESEGSLAQQDEPGLGWKGQPRRKGQLSGEGPPAPQGWDRWEPDPQVLSPAPEAPAQNPIEIMHVTLAYSRTVNCYMCTPQRKPQTLA